MLAFVRSHWALVEGEREGCKDLHMYTDIREHDAGFLLRLLNESLAAGNLRWKMPI